jgi:phage shock protein PspC (stress-responsive transcriptional regulator)
MNKTVNINLANTFFHIDENAYTKLKLYLKKLEDGFKNTVGKEEILKDIEARIAELFQEVKTNPDYVVSESDVARIIDVLGQPEDFLSEEEETEETIRKKLFRDPDDKYIGGVASGLGHYFTIDTAWIRILWLLLAVFSGGTFVLIYILFWILVPMAKTTADKLSMKGKPINVSTIEKKIKEEFEDLSSKIKDLDYEKAGNTLKKKSRNFFQFLEGILSAIPKIIFKLLGILFLIVSTSIIVSIFVASLVLLFFGIVLWPFELFDVGPVPNILWGISMFLVVLIPLLFLFSLGIRLVRGRSSSFGRVGRLVLVGLWIASVLSLVVLGADTIRSHRITATKTDLHNLPLTHQDTLRVRLIKTGTESSDWEFKKNNPINKIVDRIADKQDLVRLSVRKSTEANSSLEIKTSAKGTSQEKAQKKAEKFHYPWEVKNSTLLLKPIVLEQNISGFEKSTIELTLYLSAGQIVFLNENLKNILSYPVKNDQDYSSKNTAGHLWKMGSSRLECLDCPLQKTEMQLHYQDAEGEEKLHLKVDKDGIELKKK